MKEKITIKLDTIDKAAKYLNVIEQIKSPIDINDGSVTIDGKSIGGVFGFDLNKTLVVTLHSCDNTEITKFNDLLSEFEV